MLEELGEWQIRPLDAVYPVVFIDAIHVKIRDGQVANRPVYTVGRGHRRRASATSSGCGSATAARAPSTGCRCSPRSRTAASVDVCIVVCDGLKGLPDAIAAIWPQAIVQTCVLHLIRNTFRYAGRSDWDADRPATCGRSTPPSTEADAPDGRSTSSPTNWGERYPAIIRLWENAWAEFVPFLAYAAEIRRVIYSTNAIESINARFRRAVRARGHFPNEQAALKCLYLAVRSLDPPGSGRERWINRWKPALNAFAMTFEGRIEINN